MGTRHIVFTGAEVERVWVFASQAWVADEVRKLALALREEVRFDHNRVDRAPNWPEPAPFALSTHRIAEAAVQVAMFGIPSRPGPAPAGYTWVGEWEGSRLLSRHSDQGLSLALQWELPDEPRGDPGGSG